MNAGDWVELALHFSREIVEFLAFTGRVVLAPVRGGFDYLEDTVRTSDVIAGIAFWLSVVGAALALWFWLR